MAQQVSDSSSHRRDQISNFAEVLRKAPARQKVFRAVYHGKKRFKTATAIADATGITTKKRVTEIAKPLAREGLFVQERIRIDNKVHTAYRKIDFVETNKRKILQLARSSTKLAKYHTKTNPTVSLGRMHRIVLRVPFKVRMHFIAIYEVSQFSKVKTIKRIPNTLYPARLPEKQVKAGIIRLLGENKTPRDWPGETNDIFTTRLRIRGRTRPAAFALKGPAKKGPLTPAMMGKHGDQIQRLFDSPAEVFFVQYEGEIKENVIKQMEQYATARAITREVFWGVIDGQDTYRLRLAYPSAFQ